MRFTPKDCGIPISPSLSCIPHSVTPAQLLPPGGNKSLALVSSSSHSSDTTQWNQPPGAHLNTIILFYQNSWLPWLWHRSQTGVTFHEYPGQAVPQPIPPCTTGEVESLVPADQIPSDAIRCHHISSLWGKLGPCSPAQPSEPSALHGFAWGHTPKQPVKAASLSSVSAASQLTPHGVLRAGSPLKPQTAPGTSWGMQKWQTPFWPLGFQCDASIKAIFTPKQPLMPSAWIKVQELMQRGGFLSLMCSLLCHRIVGKATGTKRTSAALII